MATTGNPGVLESAFPDVVAELTRHWNDGRVSAYLDSLLIDTRGGRLGFPLEAVGELLFLRDLNRWRSHDDARDAAISPENFSFGTS
jgi:hypothetical protein